MQGKQVLIIFARVKYRLTGMFCLKRPIRVGQRPIQTTVEIERRASFERGCVGTSSQGGDLLSFMSYCTTRVVARKPSRHCQPLQDLECISLVKLMQGGEQRGTR
jgi:hypothetical protein